MSSMKKNTPSFGEGVVLFLIGLGLCALGDPAVLIIGVVLIVIGCVIMAGVL